MNNIYNIIINLVVFTPIVVIFSILPLLTRKDIMFGITIPPSEWKNDYFTKLRKKYISYSIVIGAVLLAASIISSAFLSEELAVVLMQVILWSALLIYFLLFLFFWIKTKKYKESADWKITAKNIVVADTNTSYLKRSLSPFWYVVYILLIAFTYFSAIRLFDLAPNMIPIRFDLQGNPVSFQPKSMTLVYQIIGTQIFLGVMFFSINFITRRAKKTIDPNNPQKSSMQNDAMKYRWSIFLFITGMLILLIFAFTLFSMFVTLSVWIIMILPMIVVLVILVYAIVLAIKTGQSGNKINSVDEKELGKDITRDDDSFWKLGMFYYNKDDPAVFVEKRFGAGWTNNWARWQSWLLIAVIAAIVVGSIVISK